MARRSIRDRADGRKRSWWWLALPALGVAAYAAFDATLSLVTPHDATRDAPPAARDVVNVDVGRAPVTAPAPGDPLAVADPLLAEPADPAPTPTATDARAAAAQGAAKTRPKAKQAPPKEDLTNQDRRALDRVIERATEQHDAR